MTEAVKPVFTFRPPVLKCSELICERDGDARSEDSERTMQSTFTLCMGVCKSNDVQHVAEDLATSICVSVIKCHTSTPVNFFS
eukprot:6195791-Pleurochrysis_carterae.AAC.3